ncbi:MAG: alpha/beta fold hydrolase, partial [Candidatus Limnocylindrales bacterium]
YEPVRPAVSQMTRTCAYDRPGTGQSGPASGCRDLDDLTAELAELLEVADEKGPYVLVAASGGGFIAAGFAAENREDIAGMVFLDVPGHEFDPPPDIMELLACDHPDSNPERRDFVGVEREAWEARAEIGDIPVTIMSAVYGPDAPAEDQLNADIQKGWLVLSPRATQVRLTTGHDVVGGQHELVIAEIEKVVLAARAP